MKKIIAFFLLLGALSSGNLFSQNLFTAYDRFGRHYDIESLNIASGRNIATGSVTSLPTVSCTSGYFTAYFDPGSVWDGNTAAQTVLCQLLSDISNFLPSPLSTNAGVGPKIKLFCSNTPTAQPGALGAATAFYVFPGTALNPNQGIVDNQIYKMITSGVDSYSNIPISFVNGNSFYHGVVLLNPTLPGGATWNTNLSTISIGSTQYDMYTILLHEITHALGFASIINGAGTSNFIASGNIFSRFDQFLYSASGVPLISSTTPSCSNSNIVFTASLVSVINSATTGCITDVTTCSTAVQYSSTSVNVPVYTPNCFESGSSLSHFEDMCPIPSNPTLGCASGTTAAANNNLYYVLSNAINTGSCYVKHYLKEEERHVLCDIGYSVNAVYGSSVVAGSSHTYAAGACSGAGVWGLNDGISAGSYIYTAALSTASVINIPVSAVLGNDSPNTTTLSCLEVISGSITAVVSGTAIVVTNTALAGGQVIIKYLPKNASGHYGSPTYIFAYFFSANCPSPNACELVQNAGFESSTGGCGPMISGVSVNCWNNAANYPAYFLRGCTSNSGIYDVGINTLGLVSPAIESYNGVPNDAFMCLSNFVSPLMVAYFPDILTSDLSSALVPGQAYQVSLWVYNPSVVLPALNNTISPVVVSVNTMPNSAFAGIPSPFASFTVNPTGIWSHVTTTLVFTPAAGHSGIQVIIDPSTALFSASSPTIGHSYSVFLDDLSIVALPSPSFAIPQSTLCGVFPTFTNLAQYASVTGTFSGTGVTFNGSQYSFNNSYALPLTAVSYPIAFTYSAGGCLHTLWDQVTTGSCCSNSSTPVFTQTSVATSSLVGDASHRLHIVNSFTVQPGAYCDFYPGEFIMDNNVKITVASTASLYIPSSHFYTCGNYLWKGIVVEDGGYVRSYNNTGNDCLIEDAETAIDISSNVTNTMTTIADINNTTFNKNRVDINFSNYPVRSSSYSNVLKINDCVFSCRSFSFTPGSWPSVSTSDLRSAGTATTGLSAPYLMEGAALANLKSPYSSQISQTALQLISVGSGTVNMPIFDSLKGISLTPSASSFLLFDAHRNFITGANSNAAINNCVFQNTQSYYDSNSTFTVSAAIQFTSSILNTKLDLSASSPGVGNRFWDCHRAVDIYGMKNFDIEYAIFRSTQSSGSLPAPGFIPPGRSGVYVATTLFQNYHINNNELTNISNGISLSCGATGFNGIAFTFTNNFPAAVSCDLTINSNTISPETSTSFTTSTSNYIKNGITVNSLSSYGIGTEIASEIEIQDNVLYRVFNGVKLDQLNYVNLPLNHLAGPKKLIANNTITLEEDGVFNSVQRGIEFTNSFSAPLTFIGSYTSACLQSIQTNTLSAMGSGALTNTNITLVHTSFNSAVGGSTHMPVPFVICNTLRSANQGFLFEGPNEPSYWRGNSMQSLSKGMILSNSAKIGQQGTSTAPSDNQWNGTWTGNFGTFVDNSTATASPLYMQTGSLWAIPTSSGNVVFSSWYGAPSTTLSATGAYTCGPASFYTQRIALPNSHDYDSDEQFYIAQTLAYRYLDLNDSITSSDSDLHTYYTSLSGSSIQKFAQVDALLGDIDTSSAESILGGIDIHGFNAVESNYYSFYKLYDNYLKNAFSGSDHTTLAVLANLCPGTSGPCIYQARALYQVVSGEPFTATDCNSGGRGARQAAPQNAIVAQASSWQVELFPNPMTDQLGIRSTKADDRLSISIKDLSGRTVSNGNIKTNNFIATLELSLINGAYIITLTNSEHEQLTKKLLIAR